MYIESIITRSKQFYRQNLILYKEISDDCPLTKSILDHFSCQPAVGHETFDGRESSFWSDDWEVLLAERL